MALFELTLALLLGAVLLAGLASRFDVPYPAVLALGGAAIAFLPFGPHIEIEPDLALSLFVAPVLVHSAFNTSIRDLKRYAAPIASLAFAAVIVTTAAVAFLTWKLAGLTLGAAIALGAIVAPPDAVAASTVLGQLRLPRRIRSVLEGESLLNDAMALLVYRLAVVAAISSTPIYSAAPVATLLALASVVAGYLLGRLHALVTLAIRDVSSVIVVQFVGTFGVWILAERLGLSAIITMVIFALTLSQFVPPLMSARIRITSLAVWDTATFVLNVFAFVLMGLQARPILARLSPERQVSALALAAAVLACVILVRFIWVFADSYLRRGCIARQANPIGQDRPDFRNDLVIGWCGMRGLVTLATAFALPADFPGRDPIILTAFAVVLGTLVLQGLTLKPLLTWLRFDPDSSVEEDVSQARVTLMRIAVDSLAADRSDEGVAVRAEYAAAAVVAANPRNPQGSSRYDQLRSPVIALQRKALTEMRAKNTVGDEAYHRLEGELDRSELQSQ